MSLRLVCTSDTHSPVDPALIPDGDVFIHAGDLMTTGYLDEWQASIDWLNALPHKTKIFVPGNHDFHLTVYPGPALQDMRRAGVTVIGLPGNDAFSSTVLPNGQRLLGLPYVMNLPRWCFNMTAYQLKKRLAELNTMAKYDIVVSHSPIKGLLDLSSRNNEHVGIELYRGFCEIQQPKLWIHGHIHEGYGEARLNDCRVVNAAMNDYLGNHVNAPVVIDI